MRARTIVVLQSLVLLACRPAPPSEPIPRATAPLVSAPVPEVPATCTYDDECPAGEICDGEACLRAPAEPSEREACGVPPIEFARGSARLSPNNQARLAAAGACLSTSALALVACRDEAAGEAPTLAEERAASVGGMLGNLGVAPERVQVTTCATASTRAVDLGIRP